jgi:hypothetical protein
VIEDSQQHWDHLKRSRLRTIKACQAPVRVRPKRSDLDRAGAPRQRAVLAALLEISLLPET